jgi:hypothetical protein
MESSWSPNGASVRLLSACPTVQMLFFLPQSHYGVDTSMHNHDGTQEKPCRRDIALDTKHTGTAPASEVSACLFRLRGGPRDGAAARAIPACEGHEPGVGRYASGDAAAGCLPRRHRHHRPPGTLPFLRD